MYFLFQCLAIFFLCLPIRSSRTTARSVEKLESDVKTIIIRNITDDGGDYSTGPGKEVILNGENQEKAVLFQKTNLFSKQINIETCSKEDGCKKQYLPSEEKNKFDKCTFEGHLVSDPDSKVSLSQCDENGFQDISIVSEKTKLQHSSYRIKDGSVTVPEENNFTDVVTDNTEEEMTKNGLDYSQNSRTKVPLVFFDKNNVAITVKDVNPKCCRASRLQCRVTKYEYGSSQYCTNQLGRLLCDKRKKGRRGFQTCAQLKNFTRKKAAEQLQQREKFGKKSEKEINSSEENTYEEEELSKEYDVKENNSKKGRQDSNVKTNHISNLSLKDLENLIREINSPKSKKETNPKCKKKKSNKFRSTIIIDTGCKDPPCRMKEPIPTEKLYQKRTVEIGIFVDKALYGRIASEMNNKDEAEVKRKIVETLHAVLVDVENFLTHESFTSLPGGFKISINGIHIYKDQDEYTSFMSDDTTMEKMLHSFKEFAYQMNGACDAEEDSYDAMILFTGRNNLADVGDGPKGYALTDAVCWIAPTIVLTLKTNGKGLHDQSSSRLLAHELGHLLGSEHDGAQSRSRNSVYFSQGFVPCKKDLNLMSPIVNNEMTTWSKCTRKMIDDANERRRREKKDCLFT